MSSTMDEAVDRVDRSTPTAFRTAAMTIACTDEWPGALQ
jgi:hypothetical protein